MSLLEGDLLLEAQAATDRRDFALALDLWSNILAQHPDSRLGLAGQFRSLVMLRRFDRAEPLLAWADQDASSADMVAIASANLAEQRQDWGQAGEFWRTLTKLHPRSPEGFIGLANCLNRLQRWSEADVVIKNAVAIFPENLYAHMVYASTANLMSDYAQAAERWALVETRFPEFPDAASHRRGNAARAREVAGEDVFEMAEPDGAVVAAPSATDQWRLAREDPAAMKAFFMRFESLGRNCEFGGIQRHFGAEPISLLRWAATEPSSLVSALSARLAGIGEPGQSSLTLAPDDEYYLLDSAYGLTLHTTVKKHEAEADLVFRKHTRRVAFLRDKLIADLTDAGKIFVYMAPRIDRETILRISEGLSAFGPNLLLCARLQDESHPPGHVEVVSDRLLIGYLDHEGLIGNAWDLSVDCWLTLCEAAYRHRLRVNASV